MGTTDRAHLDYLSVDQFNEVVGLEYPGFGHLVILGHVETSRFKLG